MRVSKLTQAGDTIVEVIIVLAVLGMAISISYATANRSLQATRQAEENSQATALLQSQIEGLRSYMADPANNIFISGHGKSYCISTSGAVVNNLDMNDDANNPTGYDTTDYSKYSAGCVQDNLYHVAIVYQPSQGDLFIARATWDDVTGSGTDTVSLVYRLHP